MSDGEFSVFSSIMDINKYHKVYIEIKMIHALH